MHPLRQNVIVRFIQFKVHAQTLLRAWSWQNRVTHRRLVSFYVRICIHRLCSNAMQKWCVHFMRFVFLLISFLVHPLITYFVYYNLSFIHTLPNAILKLKMVTLYLISIIWYFLSYRFEYIKMNIKEKNLSAFMSMFHSSSLSVILPLVDGFLDYNLCSYLLLFYGFPDL